MMRISPAAAMYLPELVSPVEMMEDPSLFHHQYPAMDPLFPMELDDIDLESFSATPKSYSSNKRFNYSETLERPTKHLKTTNTTWNNATATATDFVAPKATSISSASSSSEIVISFEHSNASSVASQQFHTMDSNLKQPKIESTYGENLDFTAAISHMHGNKVAVASATTRSATQAQDHVLAERKRREKLSQRFIALSTILPGLKKMDKATVLEDAIKYVKQLQERVKNLEEKVAHQTVETAISVKRSVLFLDDDGSTTSDQNSDLSFPEITARVSGKDVLIRIHCEKHTEQPASILSVIEKHNLTVQSSCFLPFGNNTLDITIIAQMNKEYCSTAKDLIKSLSQALRQNI